MLHNPFSAPLATPAARPALQLTGLQYFDNRSSSGEGFSDSRTHGYQGPSRFVTFHNASSPGGSAISRSPDGERCVVAGKDSLRILRVSDGSERPASEHRYAIGKGGFRIDVSKNFWSGSGLKVDSAMTDVVWCHKALDTKILTSARNGEIFLWDLHKPGSLKYEIRKKGHARSINKLSYSSSLPHYCSSGSADGNLRVWDLRALSKELFYIHHSFAIRTVIFSPSGFETFNAITGLEDGSMCRWDLRMGQKGLLERVPVAHSGAILSLDWRETGISGGWLATAGLDRTVKVWDFSDGQVQLSRKPAYVLHTSYPVRRVTWRPGYETELAVASYNESAYDPTSKSTPSSSVNIPSVIGNLSSDAVQGQNSLGGSRKDVQQILGVTEIRSAGEGATERSGDLIEIWDVRRPWLAKWTVDGSNCEGGVSDMTFADSHALWVQHPSGAFSQMDLRFCDKPIDSVPRSALTWTPTGSLTFVCENVEQWEVPYDDMAKGVSSDPEEKTNPHKRLGGRPFIPSSQTVGTIFEVDDSEDWEKFSFLARNYKIEGADQSTLCEVNADTAFEAGSYETGRIWLLLRSLVTDIGIPSSTSPPLSRRNSTPALPHSTSAPAAVPMVKRSPLKIPETRSSSSDPPNPIHKIAKKRSAGLPSVSMALTSSVRAPVSPALSQNVAGHENGKQPLLNDEHNKLRRKNLNVSTLSRPRRLSLRRSASMKAVQSEEQQLPSKSRTVRRVGEGALDDSDSSDGEDATLTPERRYSMVKERASVESIASSAGESLRPSQAQTHIVSSPGLAEDNEWAEDEREDSASPTSSSEFESDNSVASTTAARSSSLKRSARSRSSTLASMAASSIPSVQTRQELPRTDSHSSVLTVTAGGDKSVPQEQSEQVEAVADTVSLAQSHKGRINRSKGLSVANPDDEPSHAEIGSPMDGNEMRYLEWNYSAIREAEDRYRQGAWGALRQIVEHLAENGDVQMCAMLACIAPKELKISAWKALKFIEGYIEVLSRFRMHDVLAYIRKYAPPAEVRESTQVQTTIYSSCASCRKPLLQPALGQLDGVERAWKGFSQCFECKRAAIMCTICHLPVRSSLFVCAVCSHGGHRDCYHRYYMRRPLVELSTYENRGRRPARLRPGAASEGSNHTSPSIGGSGSLYEQSMSKVMGHPCAAGCGHFCWTMKESMP